MSTRLDHIVIGAADLSAGVDYVYQQLGVQIPYGGQHHKMGTHNHLMKLADNLFIEVIAINPNAHQICRARWYGLDDSALIDSIKCSPRLIAWVVNTDDIEYTLSQSDYDFGQPELINRDDLSWYFALPKDGSLLEAGVVPYLMQWNTEQHPAAKMADCGCELVKLDIFHQYPNRINTILEQIGAQGLIQLHELTDHQQPYLQATINTPAGIKTINSKS